MSPKLSDKDYNPKIEKMLNISSEFKYMTRREYLNIVANAIGANESTFEFYYCFYPENFFILDANVDDKEQLSLISIYYWLQALQTHYKFSLKEKSFVHCIDIDKDITLQEAVVILQRLLQKNEYDNVPDEEPIWKYDMRFGKSYIKAKASGILKKEDLAYYIPIDCRITESDCKILLSRFLQLKRRRYIDGNNIEYGVSDIKYIEYLSSKQ